MEFEKLLSRRQQLEVLTSLGARGEFPLKFSYLGDGAEKWTAIARERLGTEGINSMEFELLSKRVVDFLNTFESDKKINVVDIGCGDGSSVFPLLDELKKQERNFSYVPVDISNEMLTIAEENISNKYTDIESTPHQLDFELGNFTEVMFEHKQKNSVNLLLFLGSTLGNFSDRRRVLTNFRDSMTADDYLLVGMELVNFSKIDALLPHYENTLVQDLTYTLPSAMGINAKNTDGGIVWDEAKSEIQMLAQLKENISVSVQGEQLSLREGEKLLLARSVKFSEPSFTDLLSSVDLRNELLTVNQDRSYLLALVQPTRYRV